MNRNTEMHFKAVPQIDIKRSKFDESHSVKTTFNVGDIVPIYLDQDILPGSTVQIDMASLVRMATPIYPVMDNLYLDVYFFFCPIRLIWSHFKEFWGENSNPWTQQTEYQIPQIKPPSGGWATGTIADYMGVPIKVGGTSNQGTHSVLPFRAYAKVFNDWFRSEVVNTECHIYQDETTRTGTNGTTGNNAYVTETELGGKPCRANKMFDYFTACTPTPQRGPSVTVPIASGQANVIGGELRIPNPNEKPLTLYPDPSGASLTSSTNYNVMMKNEGLSGWTAEAHTTNTDSTTGGAATFAKLYAGNLYADIEQATMVSINQLRTAFAIQKYYESATNGTRYIEYLKRVFGVTSSDARMQRSEYLGGKRYPINMDAVVQTSSTDATTPQGNVSAFSCTINSDDMFTKSFEEHGILLGLAVVRTEHTYQQGLSKAWTRKKWLDFYNPYFSNLGNMPVYSSEIVWNGNDPRGADTGVFGYQEAWAEYRYKPSLVTGYMRSKADQPLDAWHYADYYEQTPTLSAQWLAEPKENVDRTIAVSSQITHQFIGDFYFKAFYTLPMPVYSVPGLIDHV